MAPIRILIVDDSVVIRRVLSQGLEEDPELEVVSTARDGRLALAKLPVVRPDIVILDVEMPEMDGLQTLGELRKAYPALPVILFSSLTQHGAAATLEGLFSGASDYVPKPSGGAEAAAGWVRNELIPKIKHLCSRGSSRPARPASGRRAAGELLSEPAAAPPSRPSARARPVARPARIDAIAIGVSTGGPNALAQILPCLPRDLPVPVLLTQHMPPMFTRLLAERLLARCQVAVVEATDGERIEPARVYLAPGDYHMLAVRDGAHVRIALDQEPPVNFCRPAVDRTFRSCASVWGAGTLAVVLTGMGQDGLRGAESVHEAGGTVLVQDEASSVVWGMPGAVARAGIARKVLPLDQIAPEILRLVQVSRPPLAPPAEGQLSRRDLPGSLAG